MTDDVPHIFINNVKAELLDIRNTLDSDLYGDCDRDIVDYMIDKLNTHDKMIWDTIATCHKIINAYRIGKRL